MKVERESRKPKVTAVEAVKAVTKELNNTLMFLDGRRTMIELESERGTMLKVCGVVAFTNGPNDGIRDDDRGVFYPFKKFAVSRFL